MADSKDDKEYLGNRDYLDIGPWHGVHRIDELEEYFEKLGLRAWGSANDERPNLVWIVFDSFYQIEMFLDYLFYFGYGDGERKWSALDDLHERVVDGEWTFWSRLNMVGDEDTDIKNMFRSDYNIRFPMTEYPLVLEAIKKYWEEIGQHKKSGIDN